MSRTSKRAIKGFKAFNKDMTCNKFKFKVGETYEENEATLCVRGFHFCTNPLDVLSYYDLCESEFCEVETIPNADIDKNENDSKIATTKIKIVAKLGLPGFIEASFDFLLRSCKTKQSGDYSKSAQPGDYSQLAQSGNYSQSAQSGYHSQLAQSGDYSQSAQSGVSSKSAQSGVYSQSAQSGIFSKSAQSGDYSRIELTGKDSVGAAIGKSSAIKGEKGCWITLAEYDSNHKPVCVKSTKIDGKKIKAGTWYGLKNKKFTELEVR